MTTKRAKQPENQPKNSGFDYRFVILAGVIIGLIYLLMPILSPFIVAIVLAYVGHPLVDRLNEIPLGNGTLGRGTAAFFVISLMLALLLLLIFIVAPLFQNELLLFIERVPSIVDGAKNLLGPWLKQHIGISINIDAAELQEIGRAHV